ncbi:MAG: hypothetical protein II968_06525 [Selenomonadaceae bacterium]|nr:hypothetical protein [Selenomonadaceae bacterium]
MAAIKDLTGQRFGRLTVLEFVGIKKHHAQWKCKCDCGNIFIAKGTTLRDGTTKSCGCLHRDVLVKDLTGQRFGRLTVLEYAGMKRRCAQWKCQCDCGNEIITDGCSLRRGRTKSCGCLNKEMFLQRVTKHNMSDTWIYKTWGGMKARCENSANGRYYDYGGRGITVCDEWRDDFQAFFDYVSKLDHFGEEGYTLDRIDNDGNYEPGNVRWATDAEQRGNKRNNVTIEYKGEQMTLSEAAWQSGIGRGALVYRYKKGKRGAELFKESQRKHTNK